MSLLVDNFSHLKSSPGHKCSRSLHYDGGGTSSAIQGLCCLPLQQILMSLHDCRLQIGLRWLVVGLQKERVHSLPLKEVGELSFALWRKLYSVFHFHTTQRLCRLLALSASYTQKPDPRLLFSRVQVERKSVLRLVVESWRKIGSSSLYRGPCTRDPVV